MGRTLFPFDERATTKAATPTRHPTTGGQVIWSNLGMATATRRVAFWQRFSPAGNETKTPKKFQKFFSPSKNPTNLLLGTGATPPCIFPQLIETACHLGTDATGVSRLRKAFDDMRLSLKTSSQTLGKNEDGKNTER